MLRRPYCVVPLPQYIITTSPFLLCSVYTHQGLLSRYPVFYSYASDLYLVILQLLSPSDQFCEIQDLISGICIHDRLSACIACGFVSFTRRALHKSHSPAVNPMKHIQTACHSSPTEHECGSKQPESTTNLYPNIQSSASRTQVHILCEYCSCRLRQPPKERCRHLASAHSHSLTHNSALRRAASCER